MSHAQRGSTIATTISEADVALDATPVDLVEATRGLPYWRPISAELAMADCQRGVLWVQ